MSQGGRFQLKDVSTTDTLIDSWYWRGLKIEHGRKGSFKDDQNADMIFKFPFILVR